MSIFLLLNLVRLELRSASEPIQPVQKIWIVLNSNLVRLMKSTASEPGLRLYLKPLDSKTSTTTDEIFSVLSSARA